MYFTQYPTPRPARVPDIMWTKHGDSLTKMGLLSRDFRTLGYTNARHMEKTPILVIVHPDDVAESARARLDNKPFTLRKEMVEFKAEQET